MKKNLPLLFLLHLLNDGIRTSFLILLPFIARDLSLSLTQVGFLGASQGTLEMLLALPGGYLATKIGGMRVLKNSLLIYSLGALGIALSPHISVLFLAFYAGALGFGVFHPVAYALTARISDKTNIGTHMGAFTSFGEVGRAVIPPLAILLTSLVGWRIAISCVGILGITVYLFTLVLSAKDQREIIQSHEHHTAWFKSLILLIKQPRLILAVISEMADNVSANSFTMFLPFLLLAKGVHSTTLALITSAFFVGGFAGKSILGRIVDTSGNVRVFISSELSMAGLILLFIVSKEIYVLFPVAFFLGNFTRGTSSVLHTLVSESADGEHFEKVFAISEVFSGIAAASAPIAAGLLADRYGISAVSYFSLGMALFAILPIYAFARVRRVE